MSRLASTARTSCDLSALEQKDDLVENEGHIGEYARTQRLGAQPSIEAGVRLFLSKKKVNVSN